MALPVLADISITNFQISGGANYTSSATPAMTIDVNTTATHLKFSCDNITYTDYNVFQSPVTGFNITDFTYGCTSTDGSKTVYAIVKDENNFESQAVSDSITLDRASPTISISNPVNGSTSESRLVTFDVNDLTAGISLSTMTVLVNGSAGSFSTSNCTQNGLNYNCSYTENKFDTNNTNYDVNISVQDNAGNSVQGGITFKYIDTNAPAQVTGFNAAAGNGQVTLSWSAISAHDLKEYLVYMGTISGFDTNSNTLIATIPAGTTSTTKTGLSNGTTYYFRVSARDKSNLEGLDSEEKNAAPSESSSGITPPSINSSTHSNDAWSTNNDPSFSWDVNSSLTYKCAFDQNSGTIPSPDCGSGNRNPDGTQEGIWYFHLKACDSLGNCSSTNHFKVKIDKTGPQQVTGLVVESNPNGTISLAWTSISDNPSGDNSGIKEYQVYRHFDDDFDAIDSRRIASINSTSFTDDGSGLTEGTRYYYKVRAVDNVNNVGSLSAESSAIFSGEIVCQNSFTFNFSNYIGGEEFVIIVNSSSTMTSPVLKVRIVDDQTGFIQSSETDSTSTSVTGVFPIADFLHGKNAEVTINSIDSSGNQCLDLRRASVDRQKPVVSFEGLREGNELLLNNDITITASDADSGLKEVGVYYRQRQTEFSFLGNASRNGTTFVLSSNDLQDITPGEVELKAQAVDSVGNKEETTLTLTAKSSDAVLGQQEFFFTGDFLEALRAKGLPEQFSTRANNLFEKTTPTRTLEVLRENGRIKARITLSFVNNGAGDVGFKIIEVIPKSFAETADRITSTHSFNVLVDDPIIEFEVGSIGDGETVQVSYELKDTLTQEQADQLLSENILSGFELPPVVVEESEQTEEIFVQNPVQPDLFFVLILVIIIIVFLILGFLALGGAAIFHLHKKSRESQIDRKLSDLEGNMMQKTSGQLKKWLEKKEAEKPKKFSWQPPKK